MTALEEIKELIRKIAQNGKSSDLVFEAEVVKVSDETITIRTEGMDISEVRTCSATDGNRQNLRIYPRIDSTVVCLDIGGDRRDIIVLQYSDIEKISIHGGEHTSVNGDLLVEQLKNLTDRVDTLYDIFKSWTPVAQDGGSALKATATTKMAGKRREDYSRIEDETLKH